MFLEVGIDIGIEVFVDRFIDSGSENDPDVHPEHGLCSPAYQTSPMDRR